MKRKIQIRNKTWSYISPSLQVAYAHLLYRFHLHSIQRTSQNPYIVDNSKTDSQTAGPKNSIKVQVHATKQNNGSESHSKALLPTSLSQLHTTLSCLLDWNSYISTQYAKSMQLLKPNCHSSRPFASRYRHMHKFVTVNESILSDLPVTHKSRYTGKQAVGNHSSDDSSAGCSQFLVKNYWFTFCVCVCVTPWSKTQLASKKPHRSHMIIIPQILQSHTTIIHHASLSCSITVQRDTVSDDWPDKINDTHCVSTHCSSVTYPHALRSTSPAQCIREPW